MKKEEEDRNGFVTRWEYDAVDRVKSQTDFANRTAPAAYSQTTVYDDALRTVATVSRSGVPTKAFL